MLPFLDRPVAFKPGLVLAHAGLMACVMPGRLPGPARPAPELQPISRRVAKRTHDRRQQRLPWIEDRPC
jgi:hypothetical protein